MKNEAFIIEEIITAVPFQKYFSLPGVNFVRQFYSENSPTNHDLTNLMFCFLDTFIFDKVQPPNNIVNNFKRDNVIKATYLGRENKNNDEFDLKQEKSRCEERLKKSIPFTLKIEEKPINYNDVIEAFYPRISNFSEDMNSIDVIKKQKHDIKPSEESKKVKENLLKIPNRESIIKMYHLHVLSSITGVPILEIVNSNKLKYIPAESPVGANANQSQGQPNNNKKKKNKQQQPPGHQLQQNPGQQEQQQQNPSQIPNSSNLIQRPSSPVNQKINPFLK